MRFCQSSRHQRSTTYTHFFCFCHKWTRTGWAQHQGPLLYDFTVTGDVGAVRGPVVAVSVITLARAELHLAQTLKAVERDKVLMMIQNECLPNVCMVNKSFRHLGCIQGTGAIAKVL
jgi:hypothetical protein